MTITRIIFILSILVNTLLSDVKVFRAGEVPSVKDFKKLLVNANNNTNKIKPQEFNELGTSKGFSYGFKETHNNSNVNVMTEKPIKISVAIQFDNNSFAIPKNSYQILDNLYLAIKNTNKKLLIEGYTNKIGTYSYNNILSLKRANAVKDYLIHKNVNPKLLISKGMGYSNPLANTNPKSAVNRRVQFQILN